LITCPPRRRYQEELEQFKAKEAAKEEEGDEEHVNGTMDALDLLKRVFQLKRFMGGGEGSGPAGGSEGAAGGAGPGPAGNAFKVEEAADPDEGLVQAGCTAVVAVKRGSELYVANAGDSRGVLSRAGKAVALSEDHKPAHETERSRIIAAGGFLSEIGGVCR
jgi:protein phosphatase 1G